MHQRKQQPLVAFVLPQLPLHQQKNTLQLTDTPNEPQYPLESTVIEDPVLPPISNQELLRRHGIIDCSIIIQPMLFDNDVIEIGEVLITNITERRKRKITRDPTYRPSKRIRRQSIGWAETRELRSLPMREVRRLREDIESITE